MSSVSSLQVKCSANNFDLDVGTSARSVLFALLANGAAPWQIFKAIHSERKGDPFYFEPCNIVGVGTDSALKLFGQFMRAMLGILGRACRAHKWLSAARRVDVSSAVGLTDRDALDVERCGSIVILDPTSKRNPSRRHFRDGAGATQCGGSLTV